MNDIAVQDQIQLLKEESLKLPQVEIPITDFFAEGIYGRMMFVPAETTITGKIHKYSTIDVLLEGSIRVVTSAGTDKVLTAPMIFVSKPGLSKAGFALTDVKWITFEATDTKNIEKFISEHVVDTDAEYQEFKKLEGETKWQSLQVP